MRGRNQVLLFVGVGLLIATASGARAAATVSQPFQGVTYIHRTETAPRPLSIHVMLIDLLAPGIGFRVTEPNGSLPGETTGETTRSFMTRQQAQVAINGDFYTWAGYPYANVRHFAASDGVAYSPFFTAEPAMHLARNNVAQVVLQDTSDPSRYTPTPQVPLWNAVSGNEYIVRNGQNTANWNELHPRSAIGYSANRKLVLFAVDGRQAGFSGGMTTPEMANMLINDYGVVQAINLDGGGSTTLTMADPAPRVLNRPSDGSERVVGNNLAVFARPAVPPVPPEATPTSFREGANLYGHVGAYLRSTLPDRNTGAESGIRVGHNPTSRGKMRAVFEFDFAGVPADATIHDVSLTLDGYSIIGSGGQYLDFELHRLEQDIDELTVSWNSARLGTSWKTPGGDFGGERPLSTLYAQNTTGLKTFVATTDFLAYAQASLRNGDPLRLMLTAPEAETLSQNWYMIFRSDDATTGQRPTLSLQYTVPEPAAALALLTLAPTLLIRRRAA